MLLPARGQALRKKQASRRRRNQCRLNLELLEDRLLLSVFFVTNTNDGGPGSLRVAIAAVNLDPLSNGQDIIEPNPANIGTISPGSALPALTRGEVTVQDFAINGSGAAGSDGLVVAADNVSLDSLTITAFGGVGVSVTGNYLTATGNTIQGNGGTGILIAGSNAILSGNVITNNGGDGIEVDGSDNQIGTGGGTAGPYQGTGGNLVSGNGEHGIYLNGSLASGNTVENNAVGADNSGTYSQGNGFWGVFLDDAPDNLIADNLISGNDQGASASAASTHRTS